MTDYPTGRVFWYAQASDLQRRAADQSEDARHYAELSPLDGTVTKTLAKALQHKSAKTYAAARSAMEAAEELPE